MSGYEYHGTKNYKHQRAAATTILGTALKLMQKDATIERMTLAANLDAKLNALAAAIGNINCQMLKKPEVTGVGVCCPPQAILNGLGVQSLAQLQGCPTAM